MAAMFIRRSGGAKMIEVPHRDFSAASQKAMNELPQIDHPIVCPVCGGATVQEKCKVICTSEVCVHRIVMNCSEF